MLHVIEAGTDAASLLLFDPLVLPDGFDAAHAVGESLDILDQLHRDGRLFWLDPGGDGAFLLHAFVEQEIDEYLVPYLRDLHTSEMFVVRGGRVYFVGGEFGFHDDESRLGKQERESGWFPLDNGRYQVSVYRTEFPVRHAKTAFRQAVTPLQRLVYSLHEAIAGMEGVAALVLIYCLFRLSWRHLLTIALPAIIVALVAPSLVRLLPAYRRADSEWRRVQREHPDVVAMFRRTAGDHTAGGLPSQHEAEGEGFEPSSPGGGTH